MVISQKDLFGEVLELPKSKQELDAVCCESCFTASEQKCICKCKGKWHGLGNLNSSKQGDKLPECRPLDKAERIIANLKSAKEVLLEP
jgi:hypothetical protein